ncbi:unnamed protein product [Discosporangium mesarthrocarpum]
MQTIWRTIEGPPRNWRSISKALQLLDHLLKHGAERITSEARDHIHTIRSLTEFTYYEGHLDKGIPVRDRADALSQLLANPERIQAERMRARDMRGTFTAVASHSDWREPNERDRGSGSVGRGYGSDDVSLDANEYVAGYDASPPRSGSVHDYRDSVESDRSDKIDFDAGRANYSNRLSYYKDKGKSEPAGGGRNPDKSMSYKKKEDKQPRTTPRQEPPADLLSGGPDSRSTGQDMFSPVAHSHQGQMPASGDWGSTQLGEGSVYSSQGVIQQMQYAPQQQQQQAIQAGGQQWGQATEIAQQMHPPQQQYREFQPQYGESQQFMQQRQQFPQQHYTQLNMQQHPQQVQQYIPQQGFTPEQEMRQPLYQGGAYGFSAGPQQEQHQYMLQTQQPQQQPMQQHQKHQGFLEAIPYQQQEVQNQPAHPLVNNNKPQPQHQSQTAVLHPSPSPPSTQQHQPQSQHLPPPPEQHQQYQQQHQDQQKDSSRDGSGSDWFATEIVRAGVVDQLGAIKGALKPTGLRASAVQESQGGVYSGEGHGCTMSSASGIRVHVEQGQGTKPSPQQNLQKIRAGLNKTGLGNTLAPHVPTQTAQGNSVFPGQVVPASNQTHPPKEHKQTHHEWQGLPRQGADEGQGQQTTWQGGKIGLRRTGLHDAAHGSLDSLNMGGLNLNKGSP